MPATTPAKIKKRDGRIVSFDPRKITLAILKAGQATREFDQKEAKRLSDLVVAEIVKRGFDGNLITVEQVQDIVEEVLIRESWAKTAKAYILYREERAKLRRVKSALGVEDELKLSVNSIKVLERRYLQKDMGGKVIETPRELFERVAKNIAAADSLYGEDPEKTEEEFLELLSRLEFLPNSPTLMNAGTPLQQLSACFVLPVDDSLESIFDAVKHAALIHQSGGGTGFSFSRLRPAGDVVRSTGGVASGPISFMRVFDAATGVIKQGGRRRGANMGILRIDHPDVLDFITAKEEEGVLSNFNISVALTDRFMEAVHYGEEYALVNPRTGHTVKNLSARKVFDLIVLMAWKNGEPGIIFIDTVNRFNPTPQLGEIESTNPCGEQPLLPYESCNLGSVNLSKMVKEEEGKIDWKKIEKTVRLATHFLDNVIDVTKFPLPQIEKMTKANRKIGLGVMGFADLLIKLGVPYNSPEAFKLAEEIMKFITETARRASVELGERRGSFPNFEKSIWPKRKLKTLRNATCTTIAPTGSISLIADCSSGIEPLFAISYVRKHILQSGDELVLTNPLFETLAKKEGFYSDELMARVAQSSSIQKIEGIPEKIRRLFVTTFDISPEDHLRMQAAFQKYTDNAVSKTINFPFEATTDDVERAYKLAYKLGCKGVTLYRDRSRRKQVLNVDNGKEEKCPECGGTLVRGEGCTTCPSCGYTACSL